MQFKVFAIVATLLGVTSAQSLKASAVSDALDGVTKLSSDTNEIVKNITDPASALENAPKFLEDLKDIITEVVKDVSMIGSGGDTNGTQFAKEAQQDICDALSDFVKVHQNLLDTIIGKEGILANTPFTAPVAAVLRVIETVVDKLAFSIIGLVPTCADDAKADVKKLDETLAEAIDTYS